MLIEYVCTIIVYNSVRFIKMICYRMKSLLKRFVLYAVLLSNFSTQILLNKAIFGFYTYPAHFSIFCTRMLKLETFIAKV